MHLSYEEAKKTIAPCIETLGPVEALEAVAYWIDDREPDNRRCHPWKTTVDKILDIVHNIEARNAEAEEMRRIGWRPGMKFEEDRDR